MKISRFVCIVFLSLTLLTSCRIVFYNVPSVRDYRIFPAREIPNAPEVSPLPHNPTYTLPDPSTWAMGKYYKEGMDAADFFYKTGTVAFLVLKNDSLCYEWYDPKYEEEGIFTTFSMAKPYVSTMIGIALHEGYIDSVDQAVADYLPEFRGDTTLERIRIRHLLQMTSGLKSNESLANPFGNAARIYYTRNLRRMLAHPQAKREPDRRYLYQNMNSQYLAWILEKATGRTLADYFAEKIWQPLGAESPASWSLDREGGDEKGYCCINAKARDFARFGLMVMHQGNWNGKSIVPASWLLEATALDTTGAALQTYQYNWYLTAEQEDFYGQGLLGQFTYVCPKTNTVIVRLGKGLKYKVPWYDMFKVLGGLTKKPKTKELDKDYLKGLAGTFVFGLSNLLDSSLYGKEAVFKRKGNDLQIKNSFNKKFKASPSSDTTFYNIRYGRRFRFVVDETGKVDSLRWYRRGNSWWLKPKE